MSTQSKKPDTGMSDFSETFSSLNELFPLNEYKSESDTVSDERSSTKPKPLQNGRTSHALIGQWGEVAEFKASQDPNDTFQTTPDKTYFEILKAGGYKYLYLYHLFQTTEFRHELKAEQRRETEAYWTERDFSGVTWTYKAVSHKRMVELTGIPESTLKAHIRKFSELRDSQGDPFLVVYEQGKWAEDAYRRRRQDGNVYVLNGVRLPSDRGSQKKQSQVVPQGIVQSVSHDDTTKTGSTKGAGTKVIVSDEWGQETNPPSVRKPTPTQSGNEPLVSIFKDLSKTLSMGESEREKIYISDGRLKYLLDICSPTELETICQVFDVERVELLSNHQGKTALNWKLETGVQDPSFNELMSKADSDRTDKKRAEAEFLRQEQARQKAIEAENELAQRTQLEVSLYGRELSDDERETKRKEAHRENIRKLRAILPASSPVMGDHKP